MATEPRLDTELTRRFSRITLSTVCVFSIAVVVTFALVGEVQLRRSLERVADVVGSLITLYADPEGEPTSVAPAMLAEMLLDTEQPFLITREVGDPDMRKVYYLSPAMPARQLESLVPASPDEVRALLLGEITTRARWRYRVLQRMNGDFDVYVLASRGPMLAGTLILVLVVVVLVPTTLAVARRATRRSVGAALGPMYGLADQTRGIGPSALDMRLRTPTGQAEATDLATAINHMLERVDSAHSQLRAFTMDASHELRTPLTHLKAQVQWALTDGRTAEEVGESLEAIERELERMTKMIEDLLLIARGENGQLEVGREAFEVAALVDDVREIAAAMCSSRNLEVRVDVNGGGQAVGDLDRARHVLINLISNAARYTMEGSITISVRHRDEQCGIDVIDTGPGVPPEHQERIFDRFYRVDSSRSRAHGGAGLGLTIARLLARLQGGDITVESGPEPGSTFTLWLPSPSR